MDISYLLWLQGIREALPGFVEQFFVIVSAIAASKALVVLPCLLLWCLDKRGGQYLLFSFSVGSLFNQFVKNTVCAYRPWIRSPEIHPVESALPEATGYSFPSGHVQSSVSLIGASGWFYRKKWPWLNIACWVFVVLVAFSRNFLGVHTPQDVLVAIVESIALLAATTFLIAWIEAREGRDRIVAIASVVITVLYLAYILVKPYPVNYDAQGQILVDPIEMQVDCFKSGGVFLGAILGWYLERIYINFETDPSSGWKRIVLRLAIGFAVVAIMHNVPKVFSLVGMDTRWFEFLKNFFTIFGAAFIAPLAFTAVEHRINPNVLR